VTFPPWLRRSLIALAITALVIVLLFFAAIQIAPGYLRSYFTGDTFRQKISEETSRGLKVEGEYGPIEQQGWEALTPEFRSQGRPGESIALLNASGITGLFNPWGIFRRRWQLDWVHLDQATVELRLSDPAAKIPLPIKPKPWYQFLLPQRIYLKEVRSDQTEVLWNFRDQPAGIHHLRLRVTPYGAKDWRFQSDDGSGLLEMAAVPPLRVASISVIVTKPWFYLEHAVLTPPDANDPGSLHLDGKAGLQEDKSLIIHAVIDRMPLAPWLPEAQQDRLQARVDAEANWDGHGTKAAGSQSDGSVHLVDTVLSHLPLLDQLALFSNNPAFRELHFTTAACDWKWNDPSLDVTHIAIEAPGLIRLEGRLHSQNGTLSGELELGLRPENLKWLPHDGSKVFTQRSDGGAYAWAKITVSGTVQKPVEDLTPRIRKAIFGSPGTLLKMGLKELFGPKKSKAVPAQ